MGLQDMINQSDKDGDGEINFDEFYRIMRRRATSLKTFHPTMTWRPHQRSPAAVKRPVSLYHTKRENGLAAMPRGGMVAGNTKVYGMGPSENARSSSIDEASPSKNTNKQ